MYPYNVAYIKSECYGVPSKPEKTEPGNSDLGLGLRNGVKDIGLELKTGLWSRLDLRFVQWGSFDVGYPFWQETECYNVLPSYIKKKQLLQ